MSIGDNVHHGGTHTYTDNKPASIGLGVVTDNWDIAHPGKVKVKIMAENNRTVDSDWMPVIMPYSANGAGFYAMPEVNSIVVLGYVDDCSVSPVVIGSIWGDISQGKTNVKNAPPKDIPNDKNSKKVFCTPSGHMIKLDESDDTASIEIISAKKQSILLDDKNEMIKLENGEGKNKVVIDGKNGAINIDAEKKLSFCIGGDAALEISKDKTDMKSQTLNYDGNTLSLKGKQTKLEGSTVEISSSGNLTVKSSGMAQVKGSMLKLN